MLKCSPLPQPNAPVIEKLEDGPPARHAGRRSKFPTFLQIVTPAGKTGYVLVDSVAPMGNDQICYVKDASGWKIGGISAVATHNSREFSNSSPVAAGCPSAPIEYPAYAHNLFRKGARLFTARLATAVTAPLLIAGTLLAFSAAPTQAKGACEDADIAVLSSPIAPWKGAPLRMSLPPTIQSKVNCR